LIERLTAAGVPCGRMRTIEDVFGDAQLVARQMLLDIQTNERPVKVPGNPIRLSGVRTPAPAAPPALGEHTDVVTRALKGQSRARSRNGGTLG
jgi:crotonobetainyl-CoA:carnitine CoA-transferase CaiB-like acyl-CoA transferase